MIDIEILSRIKLIEINTNWIWVMYPTTSWAPVNAFPGATSEFWRTKNPKIQRRLFWVRQSWLFGVGLEEEKTCWASFNWQAAPHRRTKMSCTTSLSSYCTYNTMPCICQTFKALSCFPYSASFFLTFPFFISLQLTRALPWISKPA